MANLITERPLWGLLGALGGAIAIAGRVMEAYELATAGLSNDMWSAIGLAIFFISVFGMLWAGPKMPDQKVTVESPTGEFISLEMPNFAAWSKLEEYTLMQAACLWGEMEPISNPAMLLPQAKPYYAMLREAIQKERIPAYIKERNGKKRPTTEPSRSVYILRGSLKFLAKKRDEKPRFLFPDQETSRHGWMRG